MEGVIYKDVSSQLQDSSSLTQTTALPHTWECTYEISMGVPELESCIKKAKDTGNFRFGS